MVEIEDVGMKRNWNSWFKPLAVAAALGALSLPAAAKDVRNYIFGHSLLNHASHTPETAVPYWLDKLAKAAGNTYVTDGQFHAMYFRQHVPPYFQWGWPGVQGGGEVPFDQANFTHVTLTALNYVQYKRPDEPYDGDNPRGLSPIEDLIEAIDWLEGEEPGIAIQLYVNWPDMGGVAPNFPPTDGQFRQYNADTRGAFNDWFVTLFEEVKKARPNTDFTMMPVGPVMSELFDTILKDVSPTDLYVDNAPHGTETLYFLASLVTYVHLYGEQPPANFAIPNSVSQTVRDAYPQLRQAVWTLRDKETVASANRPPEPGTSRAEAAGLVEEETAAVRPEEVAPAPLPVEPETTGFDATYFVLPGNASTLSEIDFDQAPEAIGTFESLNWRYATGPVWEDGPAEHFAARIRGTITVTERGPYVFF